VEAGLKLSDLTTEQRDHLNRVCEMNRVAEAGRLGAAIGDEFDSSKEEYTTWRSRVLGDYKVVPPAHMIKEICTGKRSTPFDEGLERWAIYEAV
jgi:hypothetical protein